MLKINDVVKRCNLKLKKISKKGKVTLIDTDKGKYIIKKNINDNKVFNYLNSRNFNYYPKVINNIEDYEVIEYIEDYDIPLEYKIMDMIDLVGLLHSKTTHYKETDIDDFKKIYEDINNNILYLYEYYNDIMTLIESKIYMNPCEYFLARNITYVYQALSYCRESIDIWYSMVKDNTRQRLVVLHNNLELNHFIKIDNSYLISWDKSKIGIPIFDLYKLYKKHAFDFDFKEVLKKYESNYPLKDDERLLLFILITLPDKIDMSSNIYSNCTKINKLIVSLNKSKILREYYTK